MFNSVQEHSKSTYGTTRHIQLTYRLIFVKCRCKGDASETSFRSLCTMAFLAARTGHISSYSCPFDLVPSRTDSSKCPLQNRVLGFQYILAPNPQNDRFWPKKARKTPTKVKNAPKRPNNGVEMTPKRCQNDP